MFICTTFFDGRPCSSWRYPDILVSPREDPGRSWGRLGCLQELSGGPGGSLREIGVSKGGSLEIEFRIPEKVHEGRTVKLSTYFDDFKKDVF